MKAPIKLADLPNPPPGRTGWPWDADSGPTNLTLRGESPGISLVTPSFNQAAYLEETIRSVLLQGYPNLQYVVIDGGSTDGSVEIIRKYEPWIDSWVSEPDRGQSHAINKGLARSDGEWFNWINSDDFLLPGALAALARTTRTGTSARLVAGVTHNLRDASVFGSYAARVAASGPAAFFSLGVNQPGSLLHRPSVQALGGVREDLRLTMDLDLWLRLLLQHGSQAFASTADAVACYRYHEASKTCSSEDVFALDEFALLYDLAAQCGVASTAPLADLRRRADQAPAAFPRDFTPSADVAERAWLDRLLVSDTLLFRALRRAQPDHPSLGAAFVQLLRSLHPSLQRHRGRQTRHLEARALIHAQQALGRFDRAMTLHALTRSPTPAVALETVRLLARHLRRR